MGIRDGDKILVLAEDNDTYHAGTSNETPATPVPPFELPPPPPENILLCGWRRDFDDMIMELDKWVPPGSKLFLLNPLEDSSGEMDPTDYMKYLLESGGFDQEDSKMENIESVEYMSGDPTEGLSGDSKVMVSMLIFRELQRIKAEEAEKAGLPKPPESTLVSEIRDPRTQATMDLTGASDSVVGNQTIAMILLLGLGWSVPDEKYDSNWMG